MTEAIEEIRLAASKMRAEFMKNTIGLSQDQMLSQLGILLECLHEDDSQEGRVSTQRCIDFVEACGAYKFPSTWTEAVRSRFLAEV